MSTGICILFVAGIFAMFTYEKRFTYQLRTAMGEFGTIEAHYLYMIICCLRAFIGPKFATADFAFMTNIVSFPFNLQNVATIIAGIGLANGSILTFVTAYKAAHRDGNVKECILYFVSLLQSYLCLIVILPYSSTFHYVPLTCIIMVLCPLVKMCWKLIISSVLKFHFNPFTWDHILPTLACLMVLCIEKISLT